MARLLRKAWLVFASPSSSSMSVSSRQHGGGDSAESPFDRLTTDLLLSIFSMLPANDLVSASLVCKAWKSLATSQSLWYDILLKECGPFLPLILFSETCLSSGPRLRLREKGTFSFQEIYTAQQQILHCVIIDGGSGYCKFGWNDGFTPCGRFPTFLVYGNIETPMHTSLTDFFANTFSRLRAKPSSQPVVLSTPICHNDETDSARAARRNVRYVMHKVLFDMGVKAICAVDQALLALFSARQTSGIVVNIGFRLTSVVPILNGKIMRNIGVEVTGQGALQLTNYLCTLMDQSSIYFDNITMIKALKEKLCYVALDYEAELCKDTTESYMTKSQGEIKLNHERFKACEILFQPHLGGVCAMSLQQAVALCMEHCMQFSSNGTRWYNKVVLCGGSACLPGLAERLDKELRKLLPAASVEDLTVISPQHEASAWLGAKILSNLTTFEKEWCITKKDFQRYGQEIIDKKSLENIDLC